MKKVFINSKENRLRAGWRILFFLLIFFALSSPVLLLRPLLGDISKSEFLENYSVLIVFISAISSTIATIIARKWFDKKSFKSLGLKWNKKAVKDLLFGFLLSALMAGMFFSFLLLFGLIELKGITFQNTIFNNSGAFDFVEFMKVLSIGSLSILLIEHILVGYWEELVFRGYLFQNMIAGMGLQLAIIISCIIYGLVHSLNPNATILSSAIIIGFGFLRIYGYLSTSLLWLSMGMHIGWNFFQGPIFGFAASGHKMAVLFKHDFLSDKQFLTGGEFGPEGSILILPVLVFALMVMRWYARSNYSNSKATSSYNSITKIAGRN